VEIRRCKNGLICLKVLVFISSGRVNKKRTINNQLACNPTMQNIKEYTNTYHFYGKMGII
jgi:hypothetical protein